MAKDYKHRLANSRRFQNPENKRKAVWRKMLLLLLLASCSAGVWFFWNNSVTPANPETTATSPIKAMLLSAAKLEKPVETKPTQFDFYTILPNKEVVVPEHEIKTRTREEWVGQAKENRYVLQAGSFKTSKEVEQLRDKLALMGYESKVEKTKAGETTWYSVKMGPYVQMSSVNSMLQRLKKNNIDAIVTEPDTTKKPAKPVGKEQPDQTVR